MTEGQELALRADHLPVRYEKTIAACIAVDKSTANWETVPGRFDTLNMHCMFPSSNRWDFPDVPATSFVPDGLAAWHEPSQRALAVDGGAIHFYLDDYRFETVWRFPVRNLPRLLEVGAALTPDFSIYRDMPTALQIFQIYRARWCGAFWASQGVTVVPSLAWGDSSTFEFVFEGLPTGSVLAIGTVGWKAFDKDLVGRAFMRAGLSEAVSRLAPSTLVVYGRLRHCDDLDLPRVVELPTFWDRRRPPKRVKELDA